VWISTGCGNRVSQRHRQWTPSSSSEFGSNPTPGDGLVTCHLLGEMGFAARYDPRRGASAQSTRLLAVCDARHALVRECRTGGDGRENRQCQRAFSSVQLQPGLSLKGGLVRARSSNGLDRDTVPPGNQAEVAEASTAEEAGRGRGQVGADPPCRPEKPRKGKGSRSDAGIRRISLRQEFYGIWCSGPPPPSPPSHVFCVVSVRMHPQPQETVSVHVTGPPPSPLQLALIPDAVQEIVPPPGQLADTEQLSSASTGPAPASTRAIAVRRP